MERSDVLAKVTQVLVEQLGVEADNVSEDTTFDDDGLRADSLDIVEMMMEFEDRFKVKIPDEEAQKFKTVKDVVDYIVNVTAPV